MEWSDNVVLDLIRDVQHTPLLWDSKDPCFKLVRKKDAAWQALAQKYMTTVEEVRKKWMSVRASYRREKSRVRQRSQTDKEFISPWFAYSAMLFYDDRYRPRGTVRKLMREHDRQQPDDDVTKDFQVEDGTDEEYEESERHTPPPENAFRNSLSQPLSHVRVRQLQRSNDTTFGVPYPHHMNWVSDEHSRDETIIFGEYVGQKLRKIDSRSRAIAIHHINAILFNAEMGQYKHSFLDVSGALQIQQQRNLSPATPGGGYFFDRGDQSTHLVVEAASSVIKQDHSNVHFSQANPLNGTTPEADQYIKILQQDESE